MAESMPQAAQYAKVGELRALAVARRERTPARPLMPTAIVQGVEVVGACVVPAPDGTPVRLD